MIRPLAVLFLFAVVALPAFAAPVPKAVKKPAVPSVSGIVWVGDDTDFKRVTYTFEASGRLTYSYGGTTYQNGTWAQDGDTLTWETNKHYADYTLKYADGVFSGSAKNVTGLTWQVAIRPQEK
jgi:hypothetical protein